MSETDIYLPSLMRVDKIIEEAPFIKTFHLKFIDEEQGNKFTFKTGQFAEYSAFGEGESTFCIASSPTTTDHIECTFRYAGKVTTALAMKAEGDIIGFRGPYGNCFPIHEWKGKNLLFVAGGIALPPMRSVIQNCLGFRDDYKKITILYGAKTADDLVYKDELRNWEERTDIDLITTVDPGRETPAWKGKVGFVPKILQDIEPSAENTVAIVCGPPIMIKYSFAVLDKLGFDDKNVYTTLENRMKCGFGKCGRCNVGKIFVCKDGPVFTYKQLKELPMEY